MSNGCIPLQKFKRVQFAVNPKMPGLIYRTKPCQNVQSLGHGEGRRWRVKLDGTKITKGNIVHWEARGGKKKKRTKLNKARQSCISGCHTHFWIMGLFLNYFDINIFLYHRWDGLTQHLKEENVGEDSGILGLGKGSHQWDRKQKVLRNLRRRERKCSCPKKRNESFRTPLSHQNFLCQKVLKGFWGTAIQLYHSHAKQVLSEQSKAHNIRERLNNCLMKSGLEECKSSLTEISWTKMSAPDCCYYIVLQEKCTGNHDSIGWGTDWFLHTSIAFITF